MNFPGDITENDLEWVKEKIDSGVLAVDTAAIQLCACFSISNQEARQLIQEYLA